MIQVEMTELAKADGQGVTAQDVQAASVEDVIRSRHLIVLRSDTASNQVGEQLRILRESLNHSQSYVAARIGKGDRRSVRRYENGETNQSITGLTEHANALSHDLIIGLHPQNS